MFVVVLVAVLAPVGWLGGRVVNTAVTHIDSSTTARVPDRHTHLVGRGAGFVYRVVL